MYYVQNIKKDSEFKFYFLGLICADGYISKKSNRVELTLKESDKDFLSILGNMITDKKLYYKQSQNAYRLSLDSGEIKEELMKYINTYEKTKHLIFPINIPQEHLISFLRGYFDGDGTIGVKMSYSKDNSHPGLRMRILGTKQFLSGYAMALKCNNLVNFVREPSKKGTENVYLIEYAFSSAKRILDALYDNANFKLNRKYEVFKKIDSSDSETLIKNYNTIKGRYNTQVIGID